MLLGLASITGPLVTFATNLIDSIGLGGVALLTATSGVIGVPGSEPVMLFAGFNVYQGHLSLLGIIVAGVVGDAVAASIAYAVGYFGTRELLERQSARLHVSRSRLDSAHRWFERHGDVAVLVSRWTPLIRAAFPFVAGVAEMPFWRFFVLSTLGSVVWISALGILGRQLGHNWEGWRHHLEYADYAAVVIVVLGVLYLALRRHRARQRRVTR